MGTLRSRQASRGGDGRTGVSGVSTIGVSISGHLVNLPREGEGARQARGAARVPDEWQCYRVNEMPARPLMVCSCVRT